MSKDLLNYQEKNILPVDELGIARNSIFDFLSRFIRDGNGNTESTFTMVKMISSNDFDENKLFLIFNNIDLIFNDTLISEYISNNFNLKFQTEKNLSKLFSEKLMEIKKSIQKYALVFNNLKKISSLDFSTQTIDQIVGYISFINSIRKNRYPSSFLNTVFNKYLSLFEQKLSNFIAGIPIDTVKSLSDLGFLNDIKKHIQEDLLFSESELDKEVETVIELGMNLKRPNKVSKPIAVNRKAFVKGYDNHTREIFDGEGYYKAIETYNNKKAIYDQYVSENEEYCVVFNREKKKRIKQKTSKNSKQVFELSEKLSAVTERIHEVQINKKRAELEALAGEETNMVSS